MGRDESNSRRHEKASLHKSFSTPVMNTSSRRIAISEVQSHSKGNPNSAWIIIHDHVYDCTNFLKEHPGRADSILINAGTDCTEEFDAIHSSKAKAMLEDYRIGELIAPSGITANSSFSSWSNSDSDIAPDHNSSPGRHFAHQFPDCANTIYDQRICVFGWRKKNHTG
jgi:nitrate reductase (NAD(P)H)